MFDFKKAKILSKEERDALLAKYRDKDGKLRFAIAPSMLVRKHRKTLDRILLAMDPKERIFVGSLITDESAISDFLLSAKAIEQFSGRIGYKCQDSDLLATLASAIDRTPPGTFKGYIFRCNITKAAGYAVDTHHKVKNRAKLADLYKTAIMQMACLIPVSLDKSIKGYSLRVDRQGNVDGTHPKKEAIAVEFLRWEKLLGMPVITPFGIDKTVGKLIYEATFIDFDQRRIQVELKRLKDIVKSIKAQPRRKQPQKKTIKTGFHKFPTPLILL